MKKINNFFSFNTKTIIKGAVATVAVLGFSLTNVNAQSCDSPNDSTLFVSEIGFDAVNLNWGAVTPKPAKGYEYYVSTTDTLPNSLTVTGTTNAVKIKVRNLNPNTNYYFWVRSVCSDSSRSSWSDKVTFKTICDSTFVNLGGDTASFCNQPTMLLKTGITDTNAIIHWNTGSTDSNIIVNRSALAVYYVTVTDKWGCTASDTIALIDVPAPALDGITYERETKFKYNFSLLTDTIATSYAWDFGDGKISNQMNPAHNYLDWGVYIVKATVSNRGYCSSSSSITVDHFPPSEIENVEDASQVVIYPNPATDMLYLKNNSNLSIASVALYNVLGQKVYEGNNSQINVAQFAAGSYNVKIVMENGTLVQSKVQIK